MAEQNTIASTFFDLCCGARIEFPPGLREDFLRSLESLKSGAQEGKIFVEAPQGKTIVPTFTLEQKGTKHIAVLKLAISELPSPAPQAPESGSR